MDDRERGGRLGELLARDPSWEVEWRRLEIGDYLLEGGVLVERKSWSDFVLSLIDGRLFGQAERMSNLPQSLFLLERDESFFEMKVRREAIQGALVTLALIYRIPVLKSMSADESLKFLGYLHHQEWKNCLCAVSRGGYRPKGWKKRRLYFLQGLPGVGPKRSVQILDHFGTIEAFMGASNEQWREMKGVAEIQIKKWRKVISEK